jgi:hypothetical protein
MMIMMYNTQMLLHSYYTTTCNGSENISTTFNIRTWRAIHIICVYRSHSSLISMFVNTLEASIQKSPNDCPLVALGVNWESSQDLILGSANRDLILRPDNGFCESGSHLKTWYTEVQTFPPSRLRRFLLVEVLRVS